MNEKNVVEAIDENGVLKPTQHLSLANELSALLKQFNFEINADGVLSPKN
jgi:predicted DNA-binding antitoxin AbrB/MazE fold protein